MTEIATNSVFKFHSYTPSEGHGLKYNPFKALVTPRPIGWISTVSPDGAVNLAPYSYFNALCDNPPILMFSSHTRKHSLENIEATGEFVHNVCSAALAEEMNTTSANYPAGVSEMAEAGLEGLASDVVAAPRLAAAPASFECKLVEIKELRDASGQATAWWMVIGEVVRAHINMDFIRDGIVDERALSLLGRLGYFNYAAVDDIFEMKRPKL